MPGTQVTYARQTILVDGDNQFEIVATCSVAGSLPDTGIFVLDIVEEEDPKDDALLRVAAIQDFSTYLTDRDAALDEGFATWRSNQVILRYDNLTTANAAAKELSSRVNSLVEDQDTNLEEFETGTGGELITYPIVDPSEVTALKDAATTANEAIAPLETARDTKATECATLQSEIDVLEERVTEAESDYAGLVSLSATLSPISTTLTTLQGTTATAVASIRTQNSSSSATSGEKAGIETQLVSLDSNLTTWSAQNSALTTAVNTELAALVSQLQTRVATLTAQRNSKLTTLSQCNQELAAAQGAVDNARTERDAAVAAARAVCADFSL